jgi:NTP pyrophosphatase (non-canonical NTP hydrolase)
MSDSTKDVLNFASNSDAPGKPLLVVDQSHLVGEIGCGLPESTLIKSIGLSFGEWPDPSRLTLTINGVDSEWVRRESSLSRELDRLGRDISDVKVAKGWSITTADSWTSKHEIPAVLALIHSEVSEALEAFRKDDRDGFDEELADVLIRVVGFAHGMGIDLGAAVLAKVEKNRGREYRHGGKRL